nr:hypothetical protein [Tanacetum cinerariifolium]
HNGPPGLNKERSRAKSVEEGNKHCTECNKDGHTREGCFKLIDYPEWWPRKKGEKNKGKAGCIKTETGPILGLTYEDYQLFLKHFSETGNSEGTKLVANMAHKEDEEGEWIFDSGCTEYFTYLSDILVNKKATHFEAPVVILNGDSILFRGIGDHILSGGTKVNGVLYVPNFKCNLLSVSRLSRDLQCCISFFSDFCVMQGLQRKNLFGAGRCKRGLRWLKEEELWQPQLRHGIKDLDMHQKGNLNKTQWSKIRKWTITNHDGNETGQIDDEGQPNNYEIETNEGEKAQAETRPTRTRTQPSRFKDFVVQVPLSVKHSTSTSNQVTSTVRYPNSNFVSYDKFSTNRKAFLADITNNDEPKCFKQAAQDARWREAMQKV